MAKQEEEPYVFGIALCTSNSYVAVAHDKWKPEIFNIGCKYTIPSVVIFARSSSHLGHEALVQKDMKQPHQMIRCVKHLIGRSCAEISSNGEDDLMAFHYEDEENKNAIVRVKVW